MGNSYHNIRKRLQTQFLCGLIVFGILVTGTACGGGSSVSQPSSPSSLISSVSVICAPSSVAVNRNSQCNATVQGTGTYSSAVTWTASEGAINASGLFTPPTSPGVVTVTATSTQDTTKSGAASLTVQSSLSTITSVAVTCTPSTVGVSASSQCNATVQGTGAYSSAITWSASAGTINASGLFTAPSSPATAT